MSTPVTDSLLTILKEPLRLVIDPNARTWWPALLGAILISIGYDLLTKRDEGKRAGDTLLFGVLFHPSSRVDLLMLFVRGFFRVLFIATLPWTAKYIAVKTISLAYAVAGAPPQGLMGTGLIVGYSVCLLLASDLSRYALHRLMHGVPVLWRFHQVHHSAEVLTPFSLYRVHPVEQLLQMIRSILVVGFTAGVFAYLSYGKASVWTLYGVPGIVMIFSVLGANLRHSQSWIPYPRWIEGFLISPAQHQLHHAISADGQRSNYGSMLAIWDRMLGSLKRSDAGRPERFGVEPADRVHDPRSIRSVILDPLYRRYP